jgi:hypothetical protein
LNSQYSGVRLYAQVRIQPRQDSTCRVQLENPRFVSYNDVLEWNQDKLASSGQEETMPSNIQTWLKTPFTVFHKRGLVEKIQTENGEPEFIVNMKKALVSKLQYDLTNVESHNSQSHNQVQRGNQGESLPVFKNEESSVLGKCETVYAINKLPSYLVQEFEDSENQQSQNDNSGTQDSSSKACEGKEYYEIIKTKNLDMCVDRPVFHKSYGIRSKTDGAGASSLPSSSSHTRTIICGSLQDYVIRKVISENKIISSASGRFETKEKLSITSLSTLDLESVDSVKEEISEPSSPKRYTSLVFEYPSGSPSSSKSMRQEQKQQQDQQQQQGQQVESEGQEKHAPIPDMTSAPQLFYPRSENLRDLKQKVVDLFAEIIESAEKMTESSKKEKDVAALSIVASKALGQLSYNELKEVESSIRAQYGNGRYEAVVQKVFFDLVSMVATNPCMKLIKDKIVSGEINQDPASWSWIISNALRSVKTPTPELLEELIELLKTDNVQENRVIRAAYAMGLTQLVNKACINTESMRNEFPYKIYGQFCNKDMDVIKNNLVPFLAQKLQESSKNDMSSVITYVNALGNLNMEESSKELLKVVEGRISSLPHPRSVAVYTLIGATLKNPSLYRPVFMSIIENVAENPEVRIAAITALTYSHPSTADLQKLAIRSWFEPSRQVSSYIYSTLKTLSQLHSSLPESELIKEKAISTLHLAKPSQEGYQSSRNMHVTYFVESLRSAVHNKVQWVSSEESFFPKSIHAKATLKGQDSEMETLETSFYMQGAEYIIDKLQEMYDDFNGQATNQQSQVNQNKRESQEKMRKLNIQDRDALKPEAYLTLKFMGLQKLYSFDDKMVADITRRVSSAIMEQGSQLEQGLEQEYFKILDLSGADYVLPTESGMPAYISRRNPTVAYNKFQLKSEKVSGGHPKMEIKMKGVTNYMRQVVGGVISPITDKFHGAGVETSVHVAVPLVAEISYRSQGQVQVSIKNSLESTLQKERNLVELEVHPYTTAHSLSNLKPLVKGSEMKTIKSRFAVKEKSLNIGKPFGLDAKVQVKTEEAGIDLYKLWDDLKVNVPMFMGSLPNPVTSSKRTHVIISHNPQNSEIKQLDFSLNIGIASKEGKHQQTKMNGARSFDQELEIQRICSEQGSSQEQESCKEQLKQKIQSPESEVVERCQQLKDLQKQRQQQQKQQQQEQQQQKQQIQQEHQQQVQQQDIQEDQQQDSNQQQQQRDQLFNQCKVERQLCKEEKRLCSQQQSGQDKSNSERICKGIADLCNQRQKSRQNILSVLQKLESGNAITISMNTILRGDQESQTRKLQTEVTIGEKHLQGRTEQTQVNMKMSLKTPNMRQPFDAQIQANGQIRRPSQKWNNDEILTEDKSANIILNGDYGMRGEQRKTIKASIVAFQSDNQKDFVKESQEFKRCTHDESQGRKLTKSCKKARHHAASLDMAQTKLSIPREVAEHRIAEIVTDLAKIQYLPYLSLRSIENRQSGENKEYEIEAHVSGEGDRMSVKVSGNGEEVIVKNIRLGNVAKGLLPVCTKDTLVTRVLQKMTSFSAPSSCVLESGKVQSFDQKEYDFSINDCEHVVFTESSTRPRVVVSTKQTPEKQQVIMVVDGHKYEVEIKKQSRYSRENKATIRVNGEEKQLASLEQQQQQNLENQQLQNQEQQQQQNQQQQQQHIKQLQQLQKQLVKEQKQQYQDLQRNAYDDKDTYVVNFKDGVYSIVSKKYGVSVLADGERMEVKSYQHSLRNRVTGLCGDMNGETTADLKSSKRCIMTAPKLSAFSFMLEDGKCRGIPEQMKTELKRQEQRCVRKEETPTKVSETFRRSLESKRQPELRHLVEETRGKTCFSKELVRVCSTRFPSEVVARQARFACKAGPQVDVLKRRIMAGDQIEELEKLPTQYIQTVYEPKHC